MEVRLSAYKSAQYSFGFDDVALVPGLMTVDPRDVTIGMDIGPHHFTVPILASAMDSAVDTRMAIALGKAGGLAVLNLQGLSTRYADPAAALDKIRKADKDASAKVIQEVYAAPVQDELLASRIAEIKAAGVVVAGSVTPAFGATLGKRAVELGLDILIIQSTVTAVDHQSSAGGGLDLEELCASVKVPVIVGNCVTYEVARALLRAGVTGILCGIGPGAACTTRAVVGVGAGQISATAECAAAREDHFQETGKETLLITDGGMSKGGDLLKAFAAGADAVMLGSPFTRTTESPGQGFHWGMATGDAGLPRGTRVETTIIGSLERLLFGPAEERTDGVLNLVGALRNGMGLLGCHTIADLQQARMVIAPSFSSEGKSLQKAQRVGMGV
ncbi:MAG: GuaB3 family IMP dehydrogenase-related protein [bacterium]